jgi:histidinol-phosphate phosphatase family protein
VRDSALPRPTVFLDRDGTIIQERDYLSDPAGVVLLPGAAEALRRLAAADFLLVVVTNQSGIARGLYSLEDYHAVAKRLDEVLAREGVHLDATFFCPHHPDFTGSCECRKPATGMYHRAAWELGAELQGSYFVGDRAKDVTPAAELGGQGILVRTGYGREEESSVEEEVWVVDSLLEAAGRILARR